MDARGRHVNSETHSSVGGHLLTFSKPGITLQSLTENDAFKDSNLRVIGISPDAVEKQEAFVKKQKLTVSLL